MNKAGNYPDKASARVREYLELLEPDFPAWLNDYINTPAMLHQQFISTTCGTLYTKLFNSHFFYSSLDHSVAVALIVWHFTHDRKQTLAALFHDIATPAFKHCVDFLNGDYLKQESTEDLTADIVTRSREIMALLRRDHIKPAEVVDYHIYPIADNDTPQLSADRLEYSLANAYFIYEIADFATIAKFYRNIEVGRNEAGLPELQFMSPQVATEFVKVTSRLSVIYRDYRTNYSMQLIADVLRSMIASGALAREELYTLKESEVIDRIEHSPARDSFAKWREAKELSFSSEQPEGVYSVRVANKVRYIDPLAEGVRISEVSDDAHRSIADNLDYHTDNYAYLDGLSL